MVKAPVAKPEKKTGPVQVLFGACRGDDEHHRRCRGALRQGADRLVLCSCPNHQGEDARCTDCGEQSPVVDLATRRCTDPEGCRDRVETKQRANPLHTMLQEVQQVAQASKATKTPAKAMTARKRTAEPRPKTGRCQHCGETTKGGLFVAGHDAKLKSALAKIAYGDGRKADRVAAAAEMIARGWARKPLPEELLLEATAMVDKAKSPAEFADRMSARRMPPA